MIQHIIGDHAQGIYMNEFQWLKMGDSSNTFVIVEVFFIPFYISEIDFFLSGDFLKLKKNINSFKIIYQKSHLRMSSLAFFLYFTFFNETNALALVHLCFNIFRNRKLRIATNFSRMGVLYLCTLDINCLPHRITSTN